MRVARNGRLQCLVPHTSAVHVQHARTPVFSRSVRTSKTPIYDAEAGMPTTTVRTQKATLSVVTFSKAASREPPHTYCLNFEIADPMLRRLHGERH